MTSVVLDEAPDELPVQVKTAGDPGLGDHEEALGVSGAGRASWHATEGADIPVEGPVGALFYITGPSAGPKGVAISHANMSAAFTTVTRYLANTADDVVLSFTPTVRNSASATS